MLTLLVVFGIFRGQQDMRTPLWIALAVNGVNIVLDALLIRGFGPIPALGVAGVAAASTVAQWLGDAWAMTVVVRRLGSPRRICASVRRARCCALAAISSCAPGC